MNTVKIMPVSDPSQREGPENYLSEHIGPLVAADDRPQANRHSLFALDHRLLCHRRGGRGDDADRVAIAGWQSGPAGDLQQALHDPRRADGLVLSDPVDSGGAREFCDPDDDRGARRGVSEAQSAELVSLHMGGAFCCLLRRRRGSGYRLDLLHALQHHLCESKCHHDGGGGIHRRVLVPFLPG